MTTKNVLVVTPLLPPATGGGGVYTMLLSGELAKDPDVNQIYILTEQFPGYPKYVHLTPKIHIYRIFPFRAGENTKTVFSYLKYAYQNIQFFMEIPLILFKYNISSLLIHSSFHNNINILWILIRLLKKFSSIKVTVDVRDPRLPVSRFYQLYSYDKIICCSENVYNHLAIDDLFISKLILIPIPIEISRPTPEQIISCLKKYELQNLQYIFNSAGIVKNKGIDRLISLTKELNQKWKKNFVLVVAGKKRDWSKEYNLLEQNGLLKFIGVISHDEVICLNSAAVLSAYPSYESVDSLPRGALESIMLGNLVLLPKGVPEFDRCCPECVMNSDDISQLACQVNTIIENQLHPQYDTNQHSLIEVLNLYKNLL